MEARSVARDLIGRTLGVQMKVLSMAGIGYLL
jgi:hypothetical protein